MSRRKQDAGFFCGPNGCINNVIDPIKVYQVPKIEDTTLHAFCVPKFFEDKMPNIPNEILNNNKHTKRIRFSSKILDTKYITLEILEGHETVGHITHIPDTYKDFLPFIQIIFEKLKAFEKLLKINHPHHKDKNKSSYPLIQRIYIVFNKTRVDNIGNQLDANVWHDDYDNMDVLRQFAIVLTPHLNTEFSINPDKEQIHKNYVKPENIRRCPGTEIGSASYWENEVIHRKPFIKQEDDTNSIRIIISVTFSFITDYIFKIADNKYIETIKKNRNDTYNDLIDYINTNGNIIPIGIPNNFTIRKEYYNSKEHLQKEVNALSQVFKQDITEPKQVGGKKKTKSRK